MEMELIYKEHDPDLSEDIRALLPNAFYTLKAMRSAPVLIMVLNSNSSSIYENICLNEHINEICDIMSIGASVENMLLKAESLGLGSLWVANTFLAYDSIKKYIKKDYSPVCSVSIGYPDEFPEERVRFRLEEITDYKWGDEYGEDISSESGEYSETERNMA